MTNGRSPAMAVNAYKRSVQRLVACVTDAVVDVAGGYYASPDPHRLTLNNGFPVALGGPSEFLFRLQEFYRVEEIGHPRTLWNVDVVEYYNTILNSEEQKVLLYHWHPRGSSSVTTPHLHLKQGAQVGRSEVRDAHLPTGEVSLNVILRVLIEEMGVQPRRPNWNSILSG